MGFAFVAVLAASAICVNLARLRSSHRALQLTAVTAVLWTAGILILWLNQGDYLTRWTQPGMGEWIAVIPMAMAIPMSFISFAYVLIGVKSRKAT